MDATMRAPKRKTSYVRNACFSKRWIADLANAGHSNLCAAASSSHSALQKQAAQL
jgi:hypothetical protein